MVKITSKMDEAPGKVKLRKSTKIKSPMEKSSKKMVLLKKRKSESELVLKTKKKKVEKNPEGETNTSLVKKRTKATNTLLVKKRKKAVAEPIIKTQKKMKPEEETNTSLVEKCKKAVEPITKTQKKIEEKAKKLEEEEESEEEKEVEVDDEFLTTKGLTKSKLKSCVEALKKVVNETSTRKKSLFSIEELPILLNITCVKIPKVPTHQMRMLLPHSYVAPDDDVALFVGDLKKGRRRDYEPTVEHYQNLLREHGCTRVTDIIPMNKVKTEFDQFELKKKLFNSYDFFIVDGKISGHLSHMLGKQFSHKRKLPTSIRMESSNLKREVDYALRKTSLVIHGLGNSHIIQIGTMKMDIDKIVDNLLAVCSILKEDYPGGWKNIRSLWIKTSTSMSIPIFVSLKSKNKVPVTEVKPKRPKAYKDVEGDLTTLTKFKSVVVTPEGSVFVKNKEKDLEEEKV